MKTWEEMSDAEKGRLLLAWHNGEVIQNGVSGRWIDASKPRWLTGSIYRVKPKETTYVGECWAYHYLSTEPSLVSFNAGGDCTHGTYTATHVNGKPTRILWEADQ